MKGRRMAGSWGTKVEAAFNQSLLLAGCPEEPAEERMGAAAGEEVQRGLQGTTKGLPADNWGTQCLAPAPRPCYALPQRKAP